MAGLANPEMIVLARQSRGYTQGALAKELDVSQGLLSKVEHGSTLALEPLMDDLGQALKYPVSFFYRPERVRGSDSICFHHRKRSSMPVRLLDTTEAQMYVTQLHVKSLLEDLDIEAPNQFLTFDLDEHGGDPRRVAQVLRRLWGIPSGPITNLVRVIEAAGGVVVFRNFGTAKLDGMSCWPRKCPPLFFINAAIPMDRARLTLAHELGHLLMHGKEPTMDPEGEATGFASEFLAPAAEIGPALRNLAFRQLPGLKAHWRLSMSAIVMAAKNSGALPPSRIRSLMMQLSQYGYRTSEPFPLPQEEPGLLNQAISVHMQENGHTVEDLAAFVDLNLDEFRTLYMPPPRTGGLRVLS